MSVQLLDKTRKINKLLHNNNSHMVVFNDICEVLSEILESNILVISRKGKVLGIKNRPDIAELHELIVDAVGGHIDEMLNERLLSVLSTKENVNLLTLGFESDDINTYQAIITPIDIAAGSGCIAVTLARLIPESRITAVDISEKALSIARENARRLDAKVDFRQGDALGELFPGQREQFDLIVSNPPYIPRSEKASIRVNVTGYEPAEALFVEDGDPLIFYRAIARNARRLLRPGGRLYFEIHENFADETFRMLTREGFPDTAVRRDLNDKNRMTCSLQRR